MPSCIRAPPAAVNTISGLFSLTAFLAAASKRLARRDAHGAAEEAEILHRDHDREAAELAAGDRDRVMRAGAGTAFVQPVGVFLAVLEFERIVGNRGQAHLAIAALSNRASKRSSAPIRS